MNRLIAVATIILALISHIYAEEFTVFDINDRGIWHGDVTGYSSIVTKGGRQFILSTSNEGGGIPLTSPQYASSAWRVPDETSFTIVSEEMEMKSILVVFDDYNGGMYIVPAMTEGGWTGILNKAACKYELTSAGELRMKALAAYGEMRIIRVIVSDEIPYVPGEDPSWKEDDLICENSFAESLAGWSVENETGFSTGWKVNRVDGMAEAGADAETAEVRTLLYKSFDLNCRRGTKLLFEQAFFGEYPEVQPGWAQLVTRAGGGSWHDLQLDVYPAPPSAGGWSRFARNEVDLSGFDGEKVEIGFRFFRISGKEAGWGIRNFRMYGQDVSGMEVIEEDEGVAEYFDMLGRPVAKPSHGIFIRSIGGRCKKVCIP